MPSLYPYPTSDQLDFVFFSNDLNTMDMNSLTIHGSELRLGENSKQFWTLHHTSQQDCDKELIIRSDKI